MFTFSTKKVDIVAVYNVLYWLGRIDKSKHKQPKQTSFRSITGTFIIELNDDECLTILDFNSLLTRFFNAIDIPDLKKRGQAYLFKNVLSHEKLLVRHPLLITEDLAQAAKPRRMGISLSTS